MIYFVQNYFSDSLDDSFINSNIKIELISGIVMIVVNVLFFIRLIYYLLPSLEKYNSYLAYYSK